MKVSHSLHAVEQASYNVLFLAHGRKMIYFWKIFIFLQVLSALTNLRFMNKCRSRKLFCSEKQISAYPIPFWTRLKISFFKKSDTDFTCMNVWSTDSRLTLRSWLYIDKYWVWHFILPGDAEHSVPAVYKLLFIVKVMHCSSYTGCIGLAMHSRLYISNKSLF